MKIVAICISASLVAGCALPAGPFYGPDPSDPRVRVPAATYRSVTSGYTSQRPAEPGSWREQNERVAPQPKSGE